MSQSFFTKVPVPEFPFQIGYESPVLSMGSCFVENIGGLLTRHKFHHLQNPFGVLYHPLVIAKNLQRLADPAPYNSSELFEHQSLWRHFDFHSRYVHPDRNECLNLLNQQLTEGHTFLRQAKTLIISLGTAIGHYQIEDQTLVANCHKLPGQQFVQQKSSVAVCVNSLQKTFEILKKLNPDLQILLTVSPVRHIKNGLVESQRSKAVLLLACEELSKNIPEVHYFPSYELILDELRDYRFFEQDLIHPNKQAIQFVWHKFVDTFFSSSTKDTLQNVEKIVKAVAHRPQFPDLPAHQQFVQKQLEAITLLENQYSNMDWSNEKERLNAE